ncbi:3'-5' exonuclease family protein [Shimia marina]|uniref:Exonuclease n=1 Tax=Shimia marina TaxID=321267 RepID=A0A0P1ETI6_9RHOB|nr:hypothetical protein [Shimia marina]CUH53891.1 hypothetical protein SHM7688_03360 [Shimia marina]SFE20142.1 hypothetical protein SAMN04488037_106150 [Shimia marina]
MKTAIIFDTEYLTDAGALGRLWFGPEDPDPMLVQIGAVALSLEDDFEVLARYEAVVMPRDRQGMPCQATPYFEELTGVSNARIAQDGGTLQAGLDGLRDFAAGAPLWSWGKDELYALGVSCYLAGIAPPIPAHRFGNVRNLVLKAGMPQEDMARLSSNELGGYYGLPNQDARAHDAVDDALSIAVALRHLLQKSALRPEDFDRPVQAEGQAPRAVG